MTEQTPDALADLIAAHQWNQGGWRCADSDRCDWRPDFPARTSPARQHAAHVAAVVRAAQADEMAAQDGRYAGMTATDAIRLVSVNRIRELTTERDAARAEVAALRAAQPGREQVARAIAREQGIPGLPTPLHYRMAGRVLALFSQDQP